MPSSTPGVAAGVVEHPPLPAGVVALARSALAEVAAAAPLVPWPVPSPPTAAEAEGLVALRMRLLGLRPDGRTSAGGAARILRGADGWVAVHLPRPDDLDLLPAWLGLPAPEGASGAAAGVPWAAVAAAVAERGVADVVATGQELGLAVAAVPTDGAAARAGDEQLAARGTLDPGRPWRLGPLGARPPRPGPPMRPPDPPLVVDLSSLWAGPLCGHLLVRLGARVVKVESTTRPDGARSGPPELFASLNDGKESRRLPLATPAGRRSLASLLAEADVVIEGSRPRALAQMGLDPVSAVGDRAGVVWASITAYGRTGPWSNRVGFGDDAAAAGGLVATHPDGGPAFAGDALADPLAGLVAAALVTRALVGGGGVLVDVALREVARSAALGGHVRWPEGGDDLA